MIPLIASTAETSLLQLLLQGGWAMIPLGILCFLTIALSSHCWQLTSPKRFIISRKEKGESSAEYFIKKQFNEDAESRQDPDFIQNQIETKESESSQWIQYLNVIASISPMVGLLGTVSGMISAFQTISAGGMGKPEQLAGDIGEALITTASGLVVAIPAMVSYFFFRNRLDKQVSILVDRLSRFTAQHRPISPEKLPGGKVN